jgi:hypothetical protein
MPPRLAAALVALFVLVVGALAGAPSASATVIGPCTAEIVGQDMTPMQTGPRDDALVVDRDSLVSVTMNSERPLTRYQVELEFAGVRWTVHDRPNEGSRWASEVPVDDYGVYGMGLWKVVTSSEGQGFTCEAEALINVEDEHQLDPLASVFGLVGLGLALAGFLGVLAVAGRIGKSRAAPVSGLLLGAMFGVGMGILLQQFSVVYPTVGVTGALIAAGAAFGLAFSLFGLPGRESDARPTIRT